MLIEAEDADFESLADAGGARGRPVAPGGFAPPEILAMLRELARGVRARFSPAAWMIVEGDEIVGLVSVKNAPDAGGRIEIGYGVAESRQCRGIAGGAIAEMLRWARSDPAIGFVTAETAEDNVASQRVLERNGFVRCGRRHDEEDGALLLWEAATESAAAPGPLVSEPQRTSR